MAEIMSHITCKSYICLVLLLQCQERDHVTFKATLFSFLIGIWRKRSCNHYKCYSGVVFFPKPQGNLHQPQTPYLFGFQWKYQGNEHVALKVMFGQVPQANPKEMACSLKRYRWQWPYCNLRGKEMQPQILQLLGFRIETARKQPCDPKGHICLALPLMF